MIRISIDPTFLDHFAFQQQEPLYQSKLEDEWPSLRLMEPPNEINSIVHQSLMIKQEQIEKLNFWLKVFFNIESFKTFSIDCHWQQKTKSVNKLKAPEIISSMHTRIAECNRKVKLQALIPVIVII